MATERENYQAALARAHERMAKLQLEQLDLPEISGPVAVRYDAYEKRLQARIEWLQIQIAQCEGGFEIMAEADT